MTQPVHHLLLHRRRSLWDFSNAGRKAVPFQRLSLDAKHPSAPLLFMFRAGKRRLPGEGEIPRGRE